jgi:hypothetical protein
MSEKVKRWADLFADFLLSLDESESGRCVTYNESCKMCNPKQTSVN